jgi:hypothetical protein
LLSLKHQKGFCSQQHRSVTFLLARSVSAMRLKLWSNRRALWFSFLRQQYDARRFNLAHQINLPLPQQEVPQQEVTQQEVPQQASCKTQDFIV